MMRALNRLTVRYAIRDARGKLFHFRSHAFRLEKGIAQLLKNSYTRSYPGIILK